MADTILSMTVVFQGFIRNCNMFLHIHIPRISKQPQFYRSRFDFDIYNFCIVIFSPTGTLWSVVNFRTPFHARISYADFYRAVIVQKIAQGFRSARKVRRGL